MGKPEAQVLIKTLFLELGWNCNSDTPSASEI